MNLCIFTVFSLFLVYGIKPIQPPNRQISLQFFKNKNFDFTVLGAYYCHCGAKIENWANYSFGSGSYSYWFKNYGGTGGFCDIGSEF